MEYVLSSITKNLRSTLSLSEDNAAVIHMTMKGRATCAHRVDVDWQYERIKVDS